VFVGLALAAQDAAARDQYGAIAYSSSTGATGWAYNHRSRGAAEGAALANCRQHASDCTVPVWFRNACGAIAVGFDGYGTGWGNNRQLAESYALKTCRDFTTGCLITRWVCTSR
jgi:serine/threonine-protein kinase